MADVTHSPLIYRLQLYYSQSMDIKSKIGNKIRKLRQQRDLSQDQFVNLRSSGKLTIETAKVKKGKVEMIYLLTPIEEKNYNQL